MDADSCSRCRFYHGASGIVCVLHPSGPVEDACGDWMPRDDLKRLNRLELLQCYAYSATPQVSEGFGAQIYLV